MNEEKREGKIRRILVAVDASPPSLTALEEAAELASRLQAELVGLYVEDINLLRLADSAFAREVGMSSGTIRQLSAQQMQCQLRGQANRVRRKLSRLAERSQIRWSFRITRGAIDAELLSAASDVDLIILGRVGWSGGRHLGSTARAMALQSPRPALFHEPRVKLRPSILIIYDGSAEAQRAISSAADLVLGLRGTLTVAILAREQEEAKRLQIDAAIWLRSQDLQARFRWLIEADGEKLLILMQEEGECLLVLPGELPIVEKGMLTPLLNSLKCPVLVVR